MACYRWCLVLGCSNSSFVTTKKEFFKLPEDNLSRKKAWVEFAGRDFNSVCKARRLNYICEDHFDLKQDLQNCREYKKGQGKPLLNTNCIPRFNPPVRAKSTVKNICPSSSKSVPNELEKFKRRFIRGVSRLLLEERRPPAEVWPMLDKTLGDGCEELWHRMRAVTLKKLRVLLTAEDRPRFVPQCARMTHADWLMFDMALVHENVDVITAGKQKDFMVLWDLMELVNKYQVDLPGCSARAWADLTAEYNAGGRKSSPLLLQLRWYELKMSTRRAFSRYWALFRGQWKNLPKANAHQPTMLQRAVAKKFPYVVTLPFEKWKDLVSSGRVITLQQLLDLNKNTKGNNDDSDLVLLEPNIETITLDDAAENIDKDNEDINDTEDIVADETAEKEQDGLSSVKIVATTQVTTDVIDKVEETDKNSEPNVVINELDETNEQKEQNDGIVKLEIELEEETLVDVVKGSSVNIDSDIVESPDDLNLNSDEIIKENNQAKDESDLANNTIETEDIVLVNDEKQSTLIIESKVPESEEIVESCSEVINKNQHLLASEHDTIVNKASVISDQVDMDIEDYDDDIVQIIDNKPVTSEMESANVHDVPSGIEVLDDGIDLIDDEDDLVVLPDLIQSDINTDTIKIEINDEELKESFDPKLLKKPIVYTTKLDQMNTFKNLDYRIVLGTKVLEDALIESKPTITERDVDIPKTVVKEETLEEEEVKEVEEVGEVEEVREVKEEKEIEEEEEEEDDVKRVKITSEMFKKPPKSRRDYNPIQLCKNPDFNTKLRRVTANFLTYETNRQHLKEIIPVTIDLDKTFERRLYNNTLYLKPEVKIEIDHSTVPIDITAGTATTGSSNISNIPKTQLTKEEEALIAERKSKVVTLPDIQKLRRINQHLLTAEVSPMKPLEAQVFEELSIKDITQEITVDDTIKRLAEEVTKEMTEHDKKDLTEEVDVKPLIVDVTVADEAVDYETTNIGVLISECIEMDLSIPAAYDDEDRSPDVAKKTDSKNTKTPWYAKHTTQFDYGDDDDISLTDDTLYKLLGMMAGEGRVFDKPKKKKCNAADTRTVEAVEDPKPEEVKSNEASEESNMESASATDAAVLSLTPVEPPPPPPKKKKKKRASVPRKNNIQNPVQKPVKEAELDNAVAPEIVEVPAKTHGCEAGKGSSSAAHVRKCGRIPCWAARKIEYLSKLRRRDRMGYHTCEIKCKCCCAEKLEQVENDRNRLENMKEKLVGVPLETGAVLSKYPCRQPTIELSDSDDDLPPKVKFTVLSAGQGRHDNSVPAGIVTNAANLTATATLADSSTVNACAGEPTVTPNLMLSINGMNTMNDIEINTLSQEYQISEAVRRFPKQPRTKFLFKYSEIDVNKCPLNLGPHNVLLTNVSTVEELPAVEQGPSESALRETSAGDVSGTASMTGPGPAVDLSCLDVPAGVHIVATPEGTLTCAVDPDLLLDDMKISQIQKIFNTLQQISTISVPPSIQDEATVIDNVQGEKQKDNQEKTDGQEEKSEDIEITEKKSQDNDITQQVNESASENRDPSAASQSNDSVATESENTAVSVPPIAEERDENVTKETSEEEQSSVPNTTATELASRDISDDGEKAHDPDSAAEATNKDQTKKSILSDLMEMSGISVEDAVERPRAQSPPPVVLTQVCSLPEMKIAMARAGTFFKYNTANGKLVRIKVSVEKIQKEHPKVDPNNVIDLTDAADVPVYRPIAPYVTTVIKKARKEPCNVENRSEFYNLTSEASKNKHATYLPMFMRKQTQQTKPTSKRPRPTITIIGKNESPQSSDSDDRPLVVIQKKKRLEEQEKAGDTTQTVEDIPEIIEEDVQADMDDNIEYLSDNYEIDEMLGEIPLSPKSRDSDALLNNSSQSDNSLDIDNEADEDLILGL